MRHSTTILVLHCVATALAVAQLNFVDGQLNIHRSSASKKKIIYFEKDHYINKATEENFCEEVCASNRPRDAVVKPGRCPPASRRQLQQLCEDECRYDSECHGAKRCCHDGCGRVCVTPDFTVTCAELTCSDDQVCIQKDASRDAVCISTKYRPGRCPAVADLSKSLRGSAKNECRYDEECSGNQKCCSNGQRNVCTAADFRVSCQDLDCAEGEACVEYPPRDAHCVSTSQGTKLCPKVDNSTQTYRSCQDSCKYDAECDGDYRCCSNGCALECLRPRRSDCEITKCKVGQKCQLDQQGNPQCKPIPCNQDGEVVDIECNSCTCIQGFLLCAQEECPPTKPGFCPRLVRGYRGQCGENCDSDYDCSGEDKCCNTGCGRGCKQSIPAIVHPCRTVRFRCGDQTRCAATRGLCQPGSPCPLVPLCVSKRVPFCKSCPDGKVCVLQKKACPKGGRCHRQPICIQLYSDETPFEENEDIEEEVVARQQGATINQS